MVIEDNKKKVFSEVKEILIQMGYNSISKIPKTLLEKIDKNSGYDVSYIKPNIPFDELKLEEETRVILAMISYKFFCDDIERKLINAGIYQ